jgi:hypothetical protein
MSFKLHFLVPDEKGPIHSKPGGTAFPVGREMRSHIACDPAMTLSEVHRGTGEPWLVVCTACQATEEFKKLYYPRPQPVTNMEYADPDL